MLVIIQVLKKELSFYQLINYSGLYLLLIPIILGFVVYILNPSFLSSKIKTLFLNSNNYTKKNESDLTNLSYLNLISYFIISNMVAFILIFMTKYGNINLEKVKSLHFFFQKNSFLIFIIISILYFVFIIIRKILFYFLSWIIEDNKIFYNWGNKIISVDNFSIFFLTTVSVFVYLNYINFSLFLKIITVLFILNIGFKIIITILNSLQYNNIQRLNFYLYFCVFQILPLLIIVSIIENFLN